MILHISDCFAPRTGGIEIQVAALAAAQHRAGQAAEVVTATPAGPGAETASWPYPVHRISARLPGQLPVHPRAGHAIDRLLTARHPRVVHVHLGAASPFAWAALACARRRGIPAVATVHSMWDPVVRALYRLLSRTGHGPTAPVAVTTVSRSAARLIRQALPDVTPRVIPNGIDAAWWRSPGAAVERQDGRVHVVAVGRLVPRKEPMELLAALHSAHARMSRRGTALRATFAGAGPSVRPIQRYLRRNGMDSWIRFAGRLQPWEVRELLAGADLFVNPSRRESFGIAALEARTSGLPVLARAHTGVADFVRHNREGALCGHSAFALADEVLWLARTPGARRTLAAHNWETEPVHCTWPVVTEAFAHAYDDVTR
ncbi:glycosyltransferase family 4 protein [Streptomyces sp. NPDC048516]|uniref:glycosyltransferase family 4 protein n=1 Tax=Streptomyces sp. NPDC048516 TaxID=3365565 RepID=UPI003719DEC3